MNDAERRQNVCFSETIPGAYYVAVTVLLDGNCDPDAPQNSYRYEDLFCLEVRERLEVRDQ